MKNKELLAIIICFTLVFSSVLLPIANTKGLTIKASSIVHIASISGGATGIKKITFYSYPSNAVNIFLSIWDIELNEKLLSYNKNDNDFTYIGTTFYNGVNCQIYEFNWNTHTVPCGEYNVRVSNTKGAMTAKYISINHNNNNRPSKPTGLSGPSIIYHYTHVTFSFSASDPDGDTLKYCWDWDGDGDIDQYTNVPSVEKSFDTMGTFQVQVMTKEIGVDHLPAHSPWSDKFQYTVTQESNIDPSIVTLESVVTIEVDTVYGAYDDDVLDDDEIIPTHGWFTFWLNPEITDGSTVRVKIESRNPGTVSIEEMCNPPNGGCTSSDIVSFTNEDEKYRVTLLGKHLTSSPVRIDLDVIDQGGNNYMSTFVLVNVVEPGQGPGPGPGPNPDPPEWKGNGNIQADAGGPYYAEDKDIRITFYGTNTKAYHSGRELKYKWDFESDGTWDTGWSSDPIAFHSYPERGVYTVTLWVRYADQGGQDQTYWHGRRDTAQVYVGDETRPGPVSDGIIYEVKDEGSKYDNEQRIFHWWKIDFKALNTYDPDGGTVSTKWLFKPTRRYFENGELKINPCVEQGSMAIDLPTWTNQHTNIWFTYYDDCLDEDRSIDIDVWMNVTDDEGKSLEIHKQFTVKENSGYPSMKEILNADYNAMDLKAFVKVGGNYLSHKTKAEHGSTNRFKIVVTHLGKDIDSLEPGTYDPVKYHSGTTMTEPWTPSINILLSDNLKNVKPYNLSAYISRKDGSKQEFTKSEILSAIPQFNGDWFKDAMEHVSRYYNPIAQFDRYSNIFSFFKSGPIETGLKNAIMAKGITLHDAELRRPSEIWANAEDHTGGGSRNGYWILIDNNNDVYPSDEKWYLFDCIYIEGKSNSQNSLKLYDLSVANKYGVTLPEIDQLYPDTIFRFCFPIGHLYSQITGKELDNPEYYMITPGEQMVFEFEAEADSIVKGDYVDWPQVKGEKYNDKCDDVPDWAPIDFNGDIAANGGIIARAEAISNRPLLAGVIIPAGNGDYDPISDPLNADYVIPVYSEQNPQYNYEDIPWFIEPNNVNYNDFIYIDNSIAENLLIDDSVIDNPVVDNPVIDDPIVDDPVVDNPVVDNPILDDYVIDNPVLDDQVINGNSGFSTLGDFSTTEVIGIDVLGCILWFGHDKDNATLNIYPPFDIECKVWDPSLQSYVESGAKFFVGDKVKFKCIVSDQDVGPVSCFEQGLQLVNHLPSNLEYLGTNKVEIKDIKIVEPASMELVKGDYSVTYNNNQIYWVINKGFVNEGYVEGPDDKLSPKDMDSTSPSTSAGTSDSHIDHGINYPPYRDVQRFAEVSIEFEARIINSGSGGNTPTFSSSDYVSCKNDFALHSYWHNYNIGKYYSFYSSDKPVYDSCIFLIYKENGDAPSNNPDDPEKPDDPVDPVNPDDPVDPVNPDQKNIPPIAKNDLAETTINKPILIDVTKNDDDPDNSNGGIDPSTLEFTQPQHGTVRIPDTEANTPVVEGLLEYTPDPSYVGEDSFAYTVKDRLGAESNKAIVTIKVFNDDDPEDPDNPDETGDTVVTILKPLEGFLYLNDKELLPLSSTWIIGKITFTASIVDPTDTVTDVKFYLDEDEIASFEFDSAEESYELMFDERTIGLRTLSVVPFAGSNPLEEVAAQIDLKMIIL